MLNNRNTLMIALCVIVQICVNIIQEKKKFHDILLIVRRGIIIGQEARKAVFDEDLNIEAYQFEGIMQKFPNHFHEHYVIGFIERGNRHLW